MVDIGVLCARSGRREDAIDAASKYFSSSSPSVLGAGNDDERFGVCPRKLRELFDWPARGVDPGRGVVSVLAPERALGVLLR